MNESIWERILKSTRLPSLPAIALEVIDLVQRRDVNIRQIADTISHDPALCSKILKTVNSSFYGQTQSVSTISHAMVILGLNSVKTLALGFSLFPNLKDSGDDNFDHVNFWKRSVYSAVAARSLAKHVNLVQQEEAFLGGLLHDLGVLAMAQTLGPEYLAILAEVVADYGKLTELEQRRFQTDHAEVGGELARHWNLPPLLIAPIQFHENPAAAPEELLPLTRCVALGSHLAHICVSGAPIEVMETYYRRADEWFHISRNHAEDLLESIDTSTIEMHRLFDLPAGGVEGSDQILSRANETLLEITLLQQAQTNQLEEQNRQLAEQAETDSLTGIANRRRFNAFMVDEFAKAQAGGGPLSLLFIDIDHFKKFNDTHGHPTGDQLLIGIAKLIQKAAPAGALVARYGGEEFTMVLPNTDRLAAVQIAEFTRRSIKNYTLQLDTGWPLSITASIGVATCDGDFFMRPEQLLKAADQAVYVAKMSGRNCVRVFTPNAKKTPLKSFNSQPQIA